MRTKYILGRNGPTRQLLGIILSVSVSAIFLFGSCKKDKSDGLPQFGTCESVPAKGNLTQTGEIFVYRTSGGGTMTIDPNQVITLTHDDFPAFKIEFWGDAGTVAEPKTSANHENLIGKHIKDRFGNVRTLIFPDGAKITIVASGEYGPLVSITIYDANEVHRINPKCNRIEYSELSSEMSQRLDNLEADGETSTIEFTATGLIHVRIYTEAQPGNKVEERILLGEIYFNSPGQCRDYFDDPRLGHT